MGSCLRDAQYYVTAVMIIYVMVVLRFFTLVLGTIDMLEGDGMLELYKMVMLE